MLLALTGLIVATSQPVPRAPGPCTLLSAAEIEAAAGGVARGLPSTRGTIATGPARGKPIHQCSWQVAATHSDLIITLVPQVSPANSAAVFAVLGSRVNAMVSRGWNASRDSTEDAVCTSVAPPARSAQPMIAMCMGLVKGVGLSVALNSTTRQLTPPQARQLFTQAAARL